MSSSLIDKDRIVKSLRIIHDILSKKGSTPDTDALDCHIVELEESVKKEFGDDWEDEKDENDPYNFDKNAEYFRRPNLYSMPVGTRFEVCDAGWDGEIIENNGKKYYQVRQSGERVELKPGMVHNFDIFALIPKRFNLKNGR